MTTLRQIVIDAFREGGLVQIGLTPDPDEFDEGLRKLFNLIDSVYGSEIGENLKPVSFGSGVSGTLSAQNEDQSVLINRLGYLPNNVRLLCNITTPSTIYLNPNPSDGARFGVVDVSGNFNTNGLTINANGRKIENLASLVLNTSSVNRQWFYRADLGNWQLISKLTANSEMPFPSEFDEFFITMLAMRLNPRFQAETNEETLQFLKRTKIRLKARYKQVEPISSERGLLVLPSTWRYQFTL